MQQYHSPCRGDYLAIRMRDGKGGRGIVGIGCHALDGVGLATDLDS